MLYATNIPDRQLLHFPLVYGARNVPEAPVLALKGTTSLATHDIPLKAVGAGPLFFTAAADLRSVPSGEYEYTLAGVSEGLLVVLSDGGIVEYLTTAKYEQYNPNA